MPLELPTIGPRELELLRLLWQHGPSSVRELRDRLDPLAYTTVLTICVRMHDKGLLVRERATSSDPARSANAYIYAPCVTEAELGSMTATPAHVPSAPQISWGTDRASVEQLLAYLGTLRDAAGERCTDAALDSIAALLERAEAAERASGARPLLRQRRPLPRAHKRAAPVEFRGRICRVCGRQAPPPSAMRRDDLRVCRNDGCRTEARRRDNLAKQRRHQQRKREAAQLPG